MDAYLLALLVVLGIGCFAYLLLRKAPPRNFNDEKAILAAADVLADYGKDQQAIELLKNAASIHGNRSQVASKLTEVTNSHPGKKGRKRDVAIIYWPIDVAG